MTVAVRPAAQAQSAASVTLVCLAHAGGNVALYREWQQRLPSWIRVHALELPGHGARRALPAHTEWPALIEQLHVDLRARVDTSRPFAVFGHSMGALVGLELLHAIRLRDGRSPVWFGVSGVTAPTQRDAETDWLDASHDAMLDKLKELGGTPDALLADREFLDLVMPLMRADFHLCGVHPLHAALAARGPLDCPIAALIGRDDDATADAADVAAWSRETRGALTTHAFDGGHFYLDGAPEPVLACVATSLAAALASSMHRPGVAHVTPAVQSKGEAWMH
ncbi:thioesterase II family protein [Paraburkholderia flava]|uniref:thioesterase II family protein n=1 Tax=Paraburkholderia flava TaxID=2547393 RepID=UPI00106205DC|nr:alpha/beta fold hydrolase [Paraburkholderia flava]